ncbi:MAG: hypothetical protein IKW89_03005 [Bacteroidales bacterium]|nr:hypothetical protein [Bacteroidales bacterium]
MSRSLILASLLLVSLSLSAQAQESDPVGFCYVRDGLLYTPDGGIMSLWGVNFQTPMPWEAKRLGKVGIGDDEESLNAVTDNNLGDVALLGANLLRCALSPAAFTDEEGNLLETPFLHALDHLVAQAGNRGMYLSFGFIVTMGGDCPGTAWVGTEYESKKTWIHDPEVVSCLKNYITQLINRVNPCDGIAYKDNKSIAYWELINEPEMFSYQEIKDSEYSRDYHTWLKESGKEDSAESYASYRTAFVRSFIDGMVALLRDNGDRHPVCWDLNWHRFRRDNKDIFDGVAASKADIVSFCNYPGQDYVEQKYWNYRYDFSDRSFSDWFNHYFLMEDGYGWTRSEAFASKAKLAYEFETFFNQSGYLYPVQALYIKALGGQAATMWTYTFKEIAPYFGGSHFLNLRCTPAKAASFVVAKHIFDSLTPGFPVTVNDEMRDEHWCISKLHDAAVYSDNDYYCSSGETASGWSGIDPSPLVRHICGLGDSPLVSYSGTGIYFIDETPGELSINLMPDIDIKGDRFFNGDYVNIVTELITDRENSLGIKLDRWCDTPGVLFSIGDGGEREALSSHEGTRSLRLKPGHYIYVKES